MASQDVTQGGEVWSLNVRSAPQAAVQVLRNAIICGKLKPGERLVEQRLAAKLGIGQPTLREALKQLEYEGFVRKLPQRGTYVTKLGQEDYCKVLEVRLILEGFAVGLATKNLKPEAEAEIASLVEEMAKATSNLDFAAFHEQDVAFHREVWELAGNEYLTRALETITFPVFAFALLDFGPSFSKSRQAAVRQHEGILAGLRTHDPLEARRAFVDETLRFWNETYGLGVESEWRPDHEGAVVSLAFPAK